VNFLPIVARELRVVSRKPWLYWNRLLFAAVGMVAAVIMFYERPGRHGQGEDMLWLLSVVTMSLALLSGGLFTADCISAEKREDTLGFLFLTNLKGYDIIAGKISTHSITAACGLLAVLPVFFLPILAGGVTWAETLRVLLAIAVAFVFALSLGVWISTRSTEGRNAVMATVTTILLAVFLPLLWLVIRHEIFNSRSLPVGVAQLSPGMLLYYARDEWYGNAGSEAIYWISIGIFAVTTIVFGALASGLLPKVWQKNGEKLGVPKKQGSRREVRWATRFGEWRRVNRFSIANPYLDLLLRRRNELRWGIFLRRAATLFAGIMLFFSFMEDDCFSFAIMTVFAMHAATKFVFAFDATRTLHEEKRSSAIELLLATPMREREITEGLTDAFRRNFRRHVHRLFALTLAVQFVAIVNPEMDLGADGLFFVSSFLWAAMIWTWSDYRTASWIGMRHALRESSHNKAMLRTFGDMVGLPWIPYFVVLYYMASNRFEEETAATVTLGWAIGGAVYQGIKARRNRTRIIREFRSIASSAGTSSKDEGKRAVFWNIFATRMKRARGIGGVWRRRDCASSS
jgi:hypothetical protein